MTIVTILRKATGNYANRPFKLIEFSDIALLTLSHNMIN